MKINEQKDHWKSNTFAVSEDLNDPVEPSPSLWPLIRNIFASIIFVHVFGLFGIFIALAYPLWWFFIPGRTVCFFCLRQRLAKKPDECPACHRVPTTIYNPTFRSLLLNTLVLFFLALIFLGMILLEIRIFTKGETDLVGLILQRRQAEFVVKEKEFALGEKNSYVDLNIRTPNQPINLVKAELEFDPDVIEVTEIDTSRSFATIFTHKTFSNERGKISIIGGLPNPGYVGEEGLLARIYFVPKELGASELKFQPSSQILANDGEGTNILSNYEAVPILIGSE